MLLRPGPIIATSSDPLDPRGWADDEREFLIFLCDRDAAIVARVDGVDYEWAKNWTWGWTQAKGGPRRREKFYARRKEQSNYHNATIYLHKEILLRAVGEPPTPHHMIGDHRNGDSLDCRRENLRWATPRMNRLNVRGACPRELFDA